jgi:hypothetical protein
MLWVFKKKKVQKWPFFKSDTFFCSSWNRFEFHTNYIFDTTWAVRGQNEKNATFLKNVMIFDFFCIISWGCYFSCTSIMKPLENGEKVGFSLWSQMHSPECVQEHFLKKKNLKLNFIFLFFWSKNCAKIMFFYNTQKHLFLQNTTHSWIKTLQHNPTRNYAKKKNVQILQHGKTCFLRFFQHKPLCFSSTQPYEKLCIFFIFF